MSKGRFFMQFVLGLLLASTLSLVLTHDAHAANRTTPYNSIETNRKAQCDIQKANIFGAVWINDTPTSSTGMDRWDEGIVVPWNATSVTVTMWSTAFACPDLVGDVQNARIINLNDYPSSPVPITSFSSTTIQRGDADPGEFTDLSPGTAGEQIGRIRITIDVTGYSAADGVKRCYTDAIQYTGRYEDDDRSGLSTRYEENLCITRQARPWTSSDYVNIYKTNPATLAIISGPLGTSTNAVPGERYTFNYTVKNDGPGPTHTTLTSQRTYTYPTTGSGWVNYSSRAAGVASGTNIFNGSMGNTGIIPASALGSSYCLTMRYSPFSSTSTGYNTSPQMCVRVPYNFNLVPSVSAANSSVSQGEPISFTHTMSNSGPTVSTAVTYAVKQFIIPPGGPFNSSVGVVDNAPGTGAPYGTAVVPQSATIVPNKAFPVNPATPVPEAAALLPVSTTGMAAGTRVCRILAVDPATGIAPQVRNRWSAPACVVIGKAPYVTIKNGDAFAGGSFQRVAATAACPATGAYAGGFRGTNANFGPNAIYGSFGEYQLLAVGTINTFGSAGQPLSTNMHYRQAPAGGFYTATSGASQTNRCIGDIVAETGLDTGGVNIGATSTLDVTAANGIIRRTGPLTLTSSGPIQPGRKVTIIVTGDVLINGNIAYSARNGATDYADIGSLPSVVIVSTGNISIAQAVTRVDGIYQAYGKFITCQEGEAIPAGIGIGSNACNQPLTVNGAVSATKFVMRRIHGGDANNAVLRNTPAELFNYRPDIILSAYAASRTTTHVQTDAEQELPARY